MSNLFNITKLAGHKLLVTGAATGFGRGGATTRALRLLSIRRGTSTCSRVAPLSRAV